MIYEPVSNTYKINKHFELCKDEPLIIQQGSQGASKTVSDLMLIIDWFRNNPSKEITICSAQKTKLMDTAFNDLKKICIDWFIWDEFKWNDNKSKLTSLSHKTGFIEFIGLDKDDIGKGRRRDLIYINELNKVSFAKYFDISQRAKKVLVDFNADFRFYIHDEINDKNFIKLDFTGNEKLPIEEVKTILSYKEKGFELDDNGDFVTKEGNRIIKNAFYANKWLVYGEGEIGSTEGRIFYWDKISEKAYNEIQGEVYYGVDWGAVDPFAVVEVKYNDGNLYVHEINYEPENSIIKNMLPQKYKEIKARDDEGLISYLFNKWGLPKDKHYICDNNRKGKILALRNAGYELAMGVGAKSKILDRLGYMSQMNIYYTESSKNIEFEQQNYCYSKDRHGNTNEQPDDINNHTIDAISYAITFLISRGIIKNL